MFNEINAALESIDTLLNWYRDFHRKQLTHINEIEHLKKRAVEAGEDDIALQHTNQLIQLRKEYAYTSGMIDGLNYAGSTILQYLGEEI